MVTTQIWIEVPYLLELKCPKIDGREGTSTKCEFAGPKNLAAEPTKAKGNISPSLEVGKNEQNETGPHSRPHTSTYILTKGG